MLYFDRSAKTSTNPRTVHGRSLAHRRLDARQRAAIAAQILSGEVEIKLSACQVAMLCGVSAPYVAAAAQLSPAKREAIAQGKDATSFTTLLASTKTLALPKPVIVTDEKLSNIIKTAGIDRVLSVACSVERNAAA